MSIPFKRILTYTPTGNSTRYNRAWPENSLVSLINVAQRARTDSFDIEVRDRDRGNGNDIWRILVGQTGGNPEGSSGVGQLELSPYRCFNLETPGEIQIHHEQSPFNADTLDVGISGELPGKFYGPRRSSLMLYTGPGTVSVVEVEIPRRCNIVSIDVLTSLTAPAFPTRAYNADPDTFDNDNPANSHLVLPASAAATVLVPGFVARYQASYPFPGHPYASESGEDKLWIDVGTVNLVATPFLQQMVFRVDYVPCGYD